MKLNVRDMELLRLLAEYRVVTPLQLVHGMGYSSSRAARRRIGKLCEARLVKCMAGDSGGNPGRPSNVYTVAPDGLAALKRDGGGIDGGISYDVVDGQGLLPQLEHQLLLNWFRIHIAHACRLIDEVESVTISANSPLACEGESSRLRESVTLDERSGSFVPDAVLLLRDGTGRGLLFYLEVDMGTEPRRSQRSEISIEEKLRSYRALFRSGGYKRYERQWNTRLTGFRLLFLASTVERERALADFVARSVPSDFVWVSSLARLEKAGAAGKIWAKGGSYEPSLRSIFGKYAGETPLPDIQD